MEVGLAYEPSWLRLLLATEFHVSCREHDKQLCSKFCKDCMERKAYCEKCTTKETHKGHQFLSVYRASHHSALRVEDVKGILDISHIHRFIINGKQVLFLISRKADKGLKNLVSKCLICGWELKKDGSELNKKSKFCSISCKLQGSVRTVTPTELKINVDPNSFKKLNREDIPEKIKLDSCSCRKRSRKGVPVRAPLF